MSQNICYHWREPGTRPCPPPSNIVFIFMHSFGKSSQIVVWHPLGVGSPFGKFCITFPFNSCVRYWIIITDEKGLNLCLPKREGQKINTIYCETDHTLWKIIQCSTREGSTFLEAVSNQLAFLTLSTTNYNVVARQHSHMMNGDEVGFQILVHCNRQQKLPDLFSKDPPLGRILFKIPLYR